MTKKPWRQAAQERCEAATEGPWYTVEPPWRGKLFGDYCQTYVVAGDPDPHKGAGVIDSILIDDCIEEEYPDLLAQSDSDLGFCAHARTDLPRALDLLDECEPLIRQLADEPCRKSSAVKPEDCGECPVCQAQKILARLA